MPALIVFALRDFGWQLNDKRVVRFWRREGLSSNETTKEGGLWRNDGSCGRLRPERRAHVWSYDFMHCPTDEGRVFCTLNIIDEYS